MSKVRHRSAEILPAPHVTATWNAEDASGAKAVGSFVLMANARPAELAIQVVAAVLR